VPLELEPFLGGTTDIVMELDAGTAGVPWELLDTDSGTRGASDPRPWAIRTKLLRKLRTEQFRAQPVDALADARVLVIGAPKCDPEKYPPLPGAIAEASDVAQSLAAALSASSVTPLIARDNVDNSGATAAVVTDTLLASDWRIVHIAGHPDVTFARKIDDLVLAVVAEVILLCGVVEDFYRVVGTDRHCFTRVRVNFRVLRSYLGGYACDFNVPSPRSARIRFRRLRAASEPVPRRGSQRARLVRWMQARRRLQAA
jgi:hypothetical protein